VSSEPAFLAGVRVLLVEDDGAVAYPIEAMLHESGCRVVGHATRLLEAFALLAMRAFDVALLDVRLGGELVFPFAEELARRGRPFVLSTASGKWIIPEALRDRPLLLKPYNITDLEVALRRALDDAEGGSASHSGLSGDGTSGPEH
jgi:CheY-like chemotaxis protein